MDQSLTAITGSALRKVGTGWEFASEAALEQFVWHHLNEVLGLRPVARQFFCLEEICDIVGIDELQRLTIVELKNTEDRYVVQQLHRYFFNLREQKAFADQVDWSKPPRLIAVAPSFHRHNRIDQEFSQLEIEFVRFAVTKETDQFFLNLFEGLATEPRKVRIPYLELDLPATPIDVPPPPSQLLEWLGACTKDEQEGFLRVRTRILSFHPKIQETVEKKSIFYGSSKTRMVAEISFERRTSKPMLFLWLPTPSNRRVIGRIRLWSENKKNITHLGHIPDGPGQMRLESEWDQISREKWPRKHLVNSITHNSH
ncbi:MAG TPA: endonuclease NucS, partial [Acidobacteriota bacterium]|nr:endonuclease NucS [Acidobacteriota bacterium]